MFWRPKSISQLVLLGLLTVIAPLCIAIFFTVQTLDELAIRNSRVSQTAVSLTRISQVFQSDMLNLERRARQYLTLQDASLLEMFKREREQSQGQLTEIRRILTETGTPDIALHQVRDGLADIMSALPVDAAELSTQLGLFAELGVSSQQFQRLSQAYVDSQLAQHRAHTDELKDSLLVMVSLLAALTAGFSLALIYWVNKPIKQIESEIHHLGAGELGHAIRISGPLEMQTLGLELEWLRNRLSELEQEKQQFMRHMSHELKTPLASLREGADLMAEGVVGDLELKQQEIVDIIQQNSRELQRLIENLLDYNQVLASQELRAEVVDLDGLWQELLHNYQLRIRKKRLDVRISGSVEEWCVDPAKMRTVLDNLLSNAVNHSPEQGIIDINWQIATGVLMVDVANSGQPIPHADQRKIFRPFYQGSAKRSGPIKGSGIGLSVARECAYAQGGTLDLVVNPDFPVCFRLQCPDLNQVAA